MPDGMLEGKVIVIIGGTSGMGLSGACACARQGAKLVAVGRDAEVSDQAQRMLGESAAVITADATDPGTASSAIEGAVARWGRIDGLYHVAGGSGRKAGDGPLHEISDAGWEYTVNLNLTSLFYSCRAAVRRFIEQGGGGTVLGLGSVLSAAPSPKYFATHAYSAAKTGAAGLIRACAAYYASQSIRFNMIMPGLVETPMSQRAMNDATVMRFIQSKQPLGGGRPGRPDDLDAAALYFLSDGSRFVTGQVLSVDGGWSVTEGQYPE